MRFVFGTILIFFGCGSGLVQAMVIPSFTQVLPQTLPVLIAMTADAPIADAAPTSGFAPKPIPTPAPKPSPISVYAVKPLAISAPSLAAGVVGSTYSSMLQASGGNAPYSWSITSGKLPAGLGLNANKGVIFGTPTAIGMTKFTVTVKDSSKPAQSQAVAASVEVKPSLLSITSSSLPSGKTGVSYTGALQASGGTASYHWSIAAGNLPSGVSLNAATGTLTGTPTVKGDFPIAVIVKDSGSPAQTAGTKLIVSVAASIVPLQITSFKLSGATEGASYSSSMAASGGTPAYTWSISAGALPAGLSMAATTGVVSGTPTATGTFNLTLAVSDSGSPAQIQSAKSTIVVAAGAQADAGAGTTWYVRRDGGTRYSTNVTSGQCNGKYDTSYASTGGTGVNQNCAFNDVRYFFQDGSWVNTWNNFPGYGWIGSGGDTYIIRGSIGTGASYRVGWNNPYDSWDAPTNQRWGIAGDPYDSDMPVPPSGTATQHTRILGENYASCHAASAKTQIHGGYGLYQVLNMSGASYVDVACLDITDFSSCGVASQTKTCNTSIGALDDFAKAGVAWSRDSTNDTLTDVHIHGMANAGMSGPTGTGMVFSYLDLIGNGASGWNADPGNGTTGTGTLLVQHYNIAWNGCAEEYPMVDAVPYQDCTDDNVGGYGDGFGTATAASSPAWNVTFDQGTVNYNTQDGLDALHIGGSGSTMTVTRSLAYGNMGQQVKIGGAYGTATNNLIVTNCNALRQAIPGTPKGYNSRLSDFCRAADAGILLTVDDAAQLVFDNNTVYSDSSTGIEIDCNANCSKQAHADFRNNIFVGFLNNSADGYPSGGTGDYSNPIYNGSGVDFFGNAGSLYSNNLTFHPKSNWSCPAYHEVKGLCTDPQLTDETWHLYGYGNMAPASGSSVVIGAGAMIPSITTDYSGQKRGTPPSIGGYEQ